MCIRDSYSLRTDFTLTLPGLGSDRKITGVRIAAEDRSDPAHPISSARTQITRNGQTTEWTEYYTAEGIFYEDRGSVGALCAAMTPAEYDALRQTDSNWFADLRSAGFRQITGESQDEGFLLTLRDPADPAVWLDAFGLRQLLQMADPAGEALTLTGEASILLTGETEVMASWTLSLTGMLAGDETVSDAQTTVSASMTWSTGSVSVERPEHPDSYTAVENLPAAQELLTVLSLLQSCEKASYIYESTLELLRGESVTYRNTQRDETAYDFSDGLRFSLRETVQSRLGEEAENAHHYVISYDGTVLSAAADGGEAEKIPADLQTASRYALRGIHALAPTKESVTRAGSEEPAVTFTLEEQELRDMLSQALRDCGQSSDDTETLTQLSQHFTVERQTNGSLRIRMDCSAVRSRSGETETLRLSAELTFTPEIS